MFRTTLSFSCASAMQPMATDVLPSWAIASTPLKAVVAGGVESMSRAQYWLPGMRWGQRMGDGAVIDAMTNTLLPATQNADLKALEVKVGPAFQAHMLAAQRLLDAMGK